MRVLVIGCGSIGQRHVRNLLRAGLAPRDITAIDPRAAALNLLPEGLNVVKSEGLPPWFFDDLVMLCTPATYRPLEALPRLGRTVFIEKPAAMSRAALLAVLPRYEATRTLVACNHLFESSVRNLLDEARRFRAQHASALTIAPIHAWPSSRAHGGDPIREAVWECAWHDVQLMTWLFGPAGLIGAQHEARGLSGQPTFANVLLTMKHDDRTSRVKVIDSSVAIPSYCRHWDFSADHRYATLHWTAPPADVNDMYLRQTEHLLELAAGRTESAFPLEAALAVVAVCEDAVSRLGAAATPEPPARDEGRFERGTQ